MRVLKFRLSGKTAFFKKPDVNTYLYFSYGHIHKVALLGIIGSILGIDGYNQQKNEIYPKFYEELSHLNIAIVPQNERGYIPKKIQTFNNSVGYASFETGGNLIVKEQWLENPKWDIYIDLDKNKYGKEIEDRFLNCNFVYIPYLGKNDHIADIKNVQILEISETLNKNRISSLFIKEKTEFNCKENIDLMNFDEELEWKYEEKLPIYLEETSNKYLLETFALTNMKVHTKDNYPLYADEDKILFFF